MVKTTNPAEANEDGGQAAAAASTVITRDDRMLGGRVIVRQPNAGYRAGLDAALLAAALDLAPGERALEAGCGVGAALLQTAVRSPGADLVGIERDPVALALAQGNIPLNGLQDRVRAIGADVADGFAALQLPPFDASFSNPPFFDDPSRLRGPHPARRGAYLADDGLQAWIGFLSKSVRDGGRIMLIHRADRLGDLLALLGGGDGVRIRPIQPFADQPAKRVLVRAVKTGKAPLVLLPALVLHDRSGGKHTAEAEAVQRGEASLAWE